MADYDFETFQRAKLAERVAFLEDDHRAMLDRILRSYPGGLTEFPAKDLTGIIALCDRTLAAALKRAKGEA